MYVLCLCVIRNTQVYFLFSFLFGIRKKKFYIIIYTTQKIAHEKNIFTLCPRRLLTQTNPCNAMKNIDSHIILYYTRKTRISTIHTQYCALIIMKKERDFTQYNVCVCSKHTDFSPFINIR